MEEPIYTNEKLSEIYSNIVDRLNSRFDILTYKNKINIIDQIKNCDFDLELKYRKDRDFKGSNLDYNTSLLLHKILKYSNQFSEEEVKEIIVKESVKLNGFLFEQKISDISLEKSIEDLLKDDYDFSEVKRMFTYD